jgi:CheY-like chemotaxis protein
MRILYIEDGVVSLQVMARIAALAGCDLVGASTASEGLSQLPSAPDLILLDLGLPDADGITLIHAIRVQAPHVPIVVVTASGLPEDRMRCLASGCADYVTKPYKVMEMMSLMRRFIPGAESA